MEFPFHSVPFNIKYAACEKMVSRNSEIGYCVGRLQCDKGVNLKALNHQTL